MRLSTKDQDEIAKLYTEAWYSGDGDKLPNGDVDEGDHEENKVQAGNQPTKSVEELALNNVINAIEYWKSTGKGLKDIVAHMELAIMNIRRNS